jgi:hypothetical protein
MALDIIGKGEKYGIWFTDQPPRRWRNSKRPWRLRLALHQPPDLSDIADAQRIGLFLRNRSKTPIATKMRDKTEMPHL